MTLFTTLLVLIAERTLVRQLRNILPAEQIGRASCRERV